MGRHLICVAKGKLEWREEPDPVLGQGQVRVRSEFAAAKHGTEMAFFKGYALDRGPYDAEYQLHRPERAEGIGYPSSVGNMLVGPVVEVGPGVTSLALGDRVCAYSGFCDMAVFNESNCWKMGPDMSWKSAVCLDPGEFAFEAVRDSHLRIGDAVAVFGLGAIGLMVLQFCKVTGAYPIIALDPLAHRRAAAEQLGATLTLDPRACDAGLEIKKASSKRGVDVAIEYSGTRAALQQALRGLAYGGTVLCGAFPPPYGAGLDLGAEAHMNLPTIVFSRACSQPDRDHPRWDEPRLFQSVWRLLSTGVVSGEAIIDPVVPFGDLVTEYPKIATNPESNIKLGVSF